MSLQYVKFEMANEREREESHYSISVVTIGILMLQQHSSVCTTKAYEKGAFGRIFEVADCFVLTITFQHTKSWFHG